MIRPMKKMGDKTIDSHKSFHNKGSRRSSRPESTRFSISQSVMKPGRGENDPTLIQIYLLDCEIVWCTVYCRVSIQQLTARSKYIFWEGRYLVYNEGLIQKCSGLLWFRLCYTVSRAFGTLSGLTLTSEDLGYELWALIYMTPKSM